MRERSEHPSPDQLRQLTRFSDVTHRHLVALATRTRWRVFEPGEVILEEGDPPDEVYAVYSGEIEIFQTVDDIRQTQSSAHKRSSATWACSRAIGGRQAR